MEQAVNRHEIIKNLKDYIYKVENTDLMTFDVLLSEIKAYIYDNEILRNEYENRLKKFDEYRNKDEYEKNIKLFYNCIVDVYNCLAAEDDEIPPILKEAHSLGENIISLHYKSTMRYFFLNTFDDLDTSSPSIIIDIFTKTDYLTRAHFTMGIWHFYNGFLSAALCIMQISQQESFEEKHADNWYNATKILDDKMEKLADFYFSELEYKIMGHNHIRAGYFEIILLKISIRNVIENLIIFLYQQKNIFGDVKIETPNLLSINFDAFTELKQLTGKEREIFLLIGARFKIDEIAKMPEFSKTKSTVEKQISSCAKKLRDTGLTQRKGQAAIIDVYSLYKNC